MATRELLSASDLVTGEIRDDIESGALKPGDRVSSDKLAAELGVSRTPIREALQRLRSEGLVTIVPRVGVFVRPISKSEVEEVYSLKVAVEPLAASRAALRGGSDPERNGRLRRTLDQLREAGRNNNVNEAAQLVDEIHNEIFVLADSDVFSEVYRVFHARVKVLRVLNMSQPGRLTVSVDHHAEVIDAIVEGRADAAAAAMVGHLTDAAQSAMIVAE